MEDIGAAAVDTAACSWLFDYVEQPGQGAAIVMELVDGVSLRKVIARRGPLSAVAALVVLKDSLLGLAAAHSRRIPHRDFKPDNVLIDGGGWCTLTDFGVAVRADKQIPAPGTPAYMAPELWHGAPSVPATDMYAATAVFFESVRGKPPFSGRLGQLRHQHESAPVPRDGLDEALRDLVAWGMAKNPAGRPRNTRSFVSESARGRSPPTGHPGKTMAVASRGARYRAAPAPGGRWRRLGDGDPACPA